MDEQGSPPAETDRQGRGRSRMEGPEGLAWLGRQPSSRSGPLFASLWHLGRLALRASGIRVAVEGIEHRPTAGGYILAIGGHRSWLDGPLAYLVSPREPRIWYLGSGTAIFRRRWLEWLMRRIGGVLPVYRGGVDVEVHLGSARAVLDAGAIFAIYPEGTRQAPATELGRFRRGIGLIALRTGALIEPVVLAGTEELYRGRRVTYRLLEPVTALQLAGLVAAPVPGSPEERDAIRAVTEALRERLADPFAALVAAAADAPDAPRRWRWMTHLFD
jgi:1-acyl-sn-glycerol-3-phosphate acyltransferase